MPRLIHQIFWNFNPEDSQGGKELHQIEAFNECTKLTYKFCDEYNIEYKL